MMQARGGYRPNAYNTTTRPVMPTTSARMIKPGYSLKNTLNVPPKSKLKAPSPPPKEVIVPEYPFISTFLFTEEEMTNSPSRMQHDITAEEELRLRRTGTLFIKDLVRKLNGPDFCKDARKEISKNAMSVAFIIFHRFYMYHSFGTFDPLDAATGALFLAAKCEECPRRMLDFSILLYHAKHPNDNVKLNPQEAVDMNNLITALETCIIRTLAFELQIVPPHITAIQALKPQLDDKDFIRRFAFRLSTDALMFTDLCLRFTPETIGAGMILAASIFCQRNLKEEISDTWFQQVSSECTEEIVYSIASTLSQALDDMKPILYSERKSDSQPDDPLIDEAGLNAEVKPEDAAIPGPSVEPGKDVRIHNEKPKDPSLPTTEREKVLPPYIKENFVVPKMASPLPPPIRDRDYLKRKEVNHGNKNGHPLPKYAKNDVVPPMLQKPVHDPAKKRDPFPNILPKDILLVPPPFNDTSAGTYPAKCTPFVPNVSKDIRFHAPEESSIGSQNSGFSLGKPVIPGLGNKLPPPLEPPFYHKVPPPQPHLPPFGRVPAQNPSELEEGEIE